LNAKDGLLNSDHFLIFFQMKVQNMFVFLAFESTLL